MLYPLRTSSVLPSLEKRFSTIRQRFSTVRPGADIPPSFMNFKKASDSSTDIPCLLETSLSKLENVLSHSAYKPVYRTLKYMLYWVVEVPSGTVINFQSHSPACAESRPWEIGADHLEVLESAYFALGCTSFMLPLFRFSFFSAAFIASEVSFVLVALLIEYFIYSFFKWTLKCSWEATSW